MTGQRGPYVVRRGRDFVIYDARTGEVITLSVPTPRSASYDVSIIVGAATSR